MGAFFKIYCSLAGAESTTAMGELLTIQEFSHGGRRLSLTLSGVDAHIPRSSQVVSRLTCTARSGPITTTTAITAAIITATTTTSPPRLFKYMTTTITITTITATTGLCSWM